MNSWTKSLTRIFLRGLVTLLPVAITIYIVYSAIVILESLLGGLLARILGEYFPGLGLLAVVVLIFLFGLLLNNLIAMKTLTLIEKRFASVPFVKAIYSPLRDLMNLFSQKDHGGLRHVVLVRIGDTGAQALGVVTREQFSDLNLGTTIEDKVAVYFPFSYGLGGYTILVPKGHLSQVNLPIEKAMSLAITGWVKVQPKAPGSDSD